MAQSNNLDEILISYIFNESNAEQELFVRNWLSKNDSNRLYFEQLVKTSGLVAAVGKIEDIDVTNEWNVFAEARVAYANSIKQHNIHEEYEIELPRIETAHSGRRNRMIFAGAFAACILVMLSVGWKYFFSGTTIVQPIVSTENIGPVVNKIYERHEVNITGSTRRVILNDGSIITLSKKKRGQVFRTF